MYVASGDHLLSVAFVGTEGATPSSVPSPAQGNAAPTPTRVSYTNLWPGIDLGYAASADGILESTWTVAPGADPARIQLRYNAPVTLDTDGGLRVAYPTGWMRESAPIAWQEIDGVRRPVQVAFVQRGATEIGFELGRYNPEHPLLIDPTMQWHTFTGGSLWTIGYAIATDRAGNVYVAGRSSNTWGTPKNAHTGYNTIDGFVAKFNGAGELQWHTFMGAYSTTAHDMALLVAVDRGGNVYAGGYGQLSWGSPVNAPAGANDVFIVKLDPAGNRLWNTFLGSPDNDYPYSAVIGDGGDLLVAGRSDASWGSPLNAYSGAGGAIAHEAFVARLNGADGTLRWNTFLGGDGTDVIIDIIGDDVGGYVLAGYSNAGWGAPVNAHAGGAQDAFVAKLDSAGALQWHTFLGGSGADHGQGVAVDGNGSIFVGGYGNATWGAPLNPFAGGDDIFVAKLDGTGVLLWNTFLGSATSDIGGRITLDNAGNVAVAGTSDASWGSAPIRAYSGNKDGFAALLDTDGTLLWNGFLGGANANPAYHDGATDIAADCAGNLYISGVSESPGWGTPVSSFTGTATNTFVARIGEPGHTVCTSAPADQGSFTPAWQLVQNGGTTTFDLTPQPGFAVNTVTGCGGAWSGGNPYTTGAITSNCLVEATFAPLTTFTVDATVDANGAVDTPSQSVYEGTGASFTVTSDAGYAPDTTVGGTCPAGSWSGATYTTGPVIADCTVQFTHSPAHEVSAGVDNHGSLDRVSATVADNSTASFTVTSDPGYLPDTTVGGDCPTGSWNGATYTTGPITAACTVSFTHSPMSYTVAATVDANGTLDAGSKTIAHGTTASFTVTPATSYLPAPAVGGDCPAGSWTGATYTTGTITAACSVSFTTIFTTYAVTPSPGPPAAAIDSGSYHSVALTSGGTVAAWGHSFNAGQTPLPAGLAGVKAVAAGFFFNLAVNGDGTVVAWGHPLLNTFGETSVPQGLNNVKGVAGGWHHALAVKNDGSVVAWGAGTTNTGTHPEYGQAIIPTDIGLVAEVAAGAYHSLALKTNRTVTAWGGFNQYGETTVPQGLSSVRAISAGYSHNLALKLDGTVVAWGAGDKPYISQPHFGQSNVPAGLTDVFAIAAGHYHSLALKADGTVVAWGAGTTSLTSGGSNGVEWGQSMVPAGLTNVVAIAAGERHSLALKDDGSIVVWGENTPNNQGTVPAALQILANGTISPNVAQQVPLGTTTQFTVTPKTGYTASVGGTCGGTLSGTLFTTDVVTGPCTVEAVFFSGGHTVSATVDPHGTLDAASTVVADGATASFTVTPSTGYSTDQAVGGDCPAGSWNGATYTTGAITSPCSVSFSHTILSHTVSAGVDANGTLDKETVAVPHNASASFTVTPSTGYSTDQVVGGDCPAGSWNGSVYTTGAITGACSISFSHTLLNHTVNATVDGQGSLDQSSSTVGHGATASFTVTPGAGQTIDPIVGGSCPTGSWNGSVYTTGPITVDCSVVFSHAVNRYLVSPSPGPLSSLVAAGYFHSMVLNADGTVTPWGYNQYGQTTQPSGLTGVVAVAAGTLHSLALKNDGTVVAWGAGLTDTGSYPEFGQSIVPAGLTDVIAITAGDEHSLALKKDGTVVAWGFNKDGQASVPAGLKDVVAIAAGSIHSLALKGDGTVVAWGGNKQGQTSVPTDLRGVVAIAAGDQHSLALKDDGTVVAWGWNVSGESTVPVGLTGVVAIAAGGNGGGTSLALKGDGRVVAWGDNRDGKTTVPVDVTGVMAVAAGGSHSLALKSDGTVVGWGNNNLGQATAPAAVTLLPFHGVHGTLSPQVPQSIAPGATASFTVTPEPGYSASVGGTCGGTLVGNVYTTDAITADCTVVATFSGAGDFNGDGTLDLADAILGLGVVTDTAPPGTVNADANGDGVTGTADVIYLLQQIGK
ncbi:MAG: SBBP repeat-containing protein [Thermodesulfobacteriota bacterium]